MSLAAVDVAVLCGGLGTRLGLPDRPKCLAEINGRPYLHWLFRKLRMHGARHVVLCAGHRGEQIIDFVASEKHSLEIDVVVEPEQRGTAAALYGARDHLTSDAILAINGDTMTDYDLCEFMFRCHGRACGTLYSRVHGTIHGDYAGHYKLLQDNVPYLSDYDSMHRWAELCAVPIIGGSYIDIGTPETLAAAGPFFDRVFNL